MLPHCCIVQSFLSLPVSFSSPFQLKTLESFNLEYIYRNVIVNIPLLYPAGRAARLLYTDKAAFPPAEQRKTPAADQQARRFNLREADIQNVCKITSLNTKYV